MRRQFLAVRFKIRALLAQASCGLLLPAPALKTAQGALPPNGEGGRGGGTRRRVGSHWGLRSPSSPFGDDAECRRRGALQASAAVRVLVGPGGVGYGPARPARSRWMLAAAGRRILIRAGWGPARAGGAVGRCSMAGRAASLGRGGEASDSDAGGRCRGRGHYRQWATNLKSGVECTAVTTCD